MTRFAPRPPIPWIIVWVIIYALILIVSFIAPGHPILTIIKIGGVMLCSVYALAVFPRDRLLQLAMVVTFIADCILAKNNVSPPGLTVFFCAQLIHLYRLVQPQTRRRVLIFAALGMIIIGLNFILRIAPAVFLIAGFYAITLLLNIIISFHWYRHDSTNFLAICAFSGFVLFACCDLCTVFSYFSLIDILPATFYIPANFLAWFFYYPSQILVSNSSKYAIMNLKEGKC